MVGFVRDGMTDRWSNGETQHDKKTVLVVSRLCPFSLIISLTKLILPVQSIEFKVGDDEPSGSVCRLLPSKKSRKLIQQERECRRSVCFFHIRENIGKASCLRVSNLEVHLWVIQRGTWVHISHQDTCPVSNCLWQRRQRLLTWERERRLSLFDEIRRWVYGARTGTGRSCRPVEALMHTGMHSLEGEDLKSSKKRWGQRKTKMVATRSDQRRKTIEFLAVRLTGVCRSKSKKKPSLDSLNKWNAFQC